MAFLSKQIYSASLTDSANGSSVDIATGNRGVKNVVAVLNASAVNAATTLDVKLQHSPDGTTWYDYGTAFSQVAGTASNQAVNQTLNIMQYVRAVATLAGATKAATVLVTLYFDEN